MDNSFDREAISKMRRSYGEVGLPDELATSDPLALFSQWLADAAANPMVIEANAMVLSTRHGDGVISRTVLLKGVSDRSFTFFTNYNSRKARDIDSNPAVSLLFPWYPLERQVIVTGRAHRVSELESDEYFASRPWSSQIGAWASHQSEPLQSRELLEAQWQECAERYPEGSVVPRPPHWGGFAVTADTIEFWQGRYSRLHDRLRFSHSETGWKVGRIFP